MNIAALAYRPDMPVFTAKAARMDDAVEQFDAIFHHLLLQSARWATGIVGAEQATFGNLLTDFLAQELARHQGGFGAMLLNTVDGPGRSRK